MKNPKLSQYIVQNFKAESFNELLLKLIKESNRTNKDIYQTAYMDQKLFSKIKQDPAYIPSKKM